MRNEIEVKRTAHYYTINEDKPINEVLYVFHGYAQLASQFIQEFSYLKNSNILVVAPEGLSKFYGKDRSPVSSWMTSHERENEIKDQISYLNLLHLKLKKQFNFSKTTILGFSQGVSTAFRWLNQLEEKTMELHICSGSIPPEIDHTKQLNEKISIAYFYYGNNDRLMKPEHAKDSILKLKELEINFEEISFTGRHEIAQVVQEKLRQSI